MSFEGKTKMLPVVELTDGVGNLGFNQITSQGSQFGLYNKQWPKRKEKVYVN